MKNDTREIDMHKFAHFPYVLIAKKNVQSGLIILPRRFPKRAMMHRSGGCVRVL